MVKAEPSTPRALLRRYVEPVRPALVDVAGTRPALLCRVDVAGARHVSRRGN